MPYSAGLLPLSEASKYDKSSNANIGHTVGAAIV